MMSSHFYSRACGVAGALLLTHSLQAGIIFSYEAPGVETTQVAGATTETFDGVVVAPITQQVNAWFGSYTATPNNASGEGSLLPYVSPVGTFSGQGIIVPADIWAGAGGTGNYLAVGEEWNPYGLNNESITLNLKSPANYLGFFSEATDYSNVVKLYDGNTLIAVVTPDILGNNDYAYYNSVKQTYGDDVLSGAYYGNPDKGGFDSGEPFFYVNLTTTGSTQITKVVFDCDGTGNGFELDNLSVASGVIPVSGRQFALPAPDGGATVLLLGGVLVGWLAFGVRGKSASA